MDLLILLLIIYLLDSSKFKILIKFYKQKGSFVIKNTNYFFCLLKYVHFMSIIWAELHKKGMRLVMYYSSGNYEAFARPKKPVNVDNKFILY